MKLVYCKLPKTYSDNPCFKPKVSFFKGYENVYRVLDFLTINLKSVYENY